LPENNTLSGLRLVYTPDLVSRCLDEAGEAMMAVRVGRLGPAGFRSSMPEPLRDFDDFMDKRRSAEIEAERRRWEPPTPAQIAHMDEVMYRWLPLLGGEMWWQRERQRLVGLRALCWPQSDREDPHVWSWRALGEEFHQNHETVRARHARAVDTLTTRLRALPAPCGATLKRIVDYHRGRITNSASSAIRR
jgi:hypothetical protein